MADGLIDINKAFPTGVGMNRLREEMSMLKNSVPHRRGDEPNAIYAIPKTARRSPQAWG